MYLTFVIILFHMYKVKYCILLIHELQLKRLTNSFFSFFFCFPSLLIFKVVDTLTQSEVWYHCCQSHFFLSLDWLLSVKLNILH